MKYIFPILLCIFLGCQSVEKPEKPDNLIPKEKMVDMMLESYLSNAARSVNNRKIRSYGLKLDSLLYAKYRVDSLQFAKSNTYYAADLETYQEMFTTIEERLKALKKEADSIQKVKEAKKENQKTEEEKEKDSILKKSGLGPALQSASQDSLE
ncbi:DUF4296 domain-containing protein [Marixanthomonas spongiae]|uniref:DUF4296 domain-containing protein n=1 Tax=Marixanthomonas spongiae TaxID=2174845 RepID=A0A2U0HZC2_9FLAO|nr:DUF4296 domain-containing protein [Marixanthomonas spongiae]PVW14169.1 DUF4296 domain-containing protein [Marixanthomonas spongiae]